MQEKAPWKDRSVLFSGVTALSVTTVNKNTHLSKVQTSIRRGEYLQYCFYVCTVHLVQFIIQTNKCTTYILTIFYIP